MQEKCGVVGIVDRVQYVAHFLYYGLLSLQHRGQESAGIVVSLFGDLHSWRRMGTVERVFSEKRLDRLLGRAGIGHTRYSTKGKSQNKNTQPFISWFRGKRLAIGHNGQLKNYRQLRRRCRRLGYKFKSTSDTEVINALLQLSQKIDFEDALKDTLNLIEGAFSLVILYDEKVYALRDRFGIRPLVVGETKTGYIVSSESATIDILNGQLTRDIEPGEVVVLESHGLRSFYWTEERQLKICIFEYIYFARDDSQIEGRRVAVSRRNMAEQFIGQVRQEENLLAFVRGHCDIIVPVADSGNAFAAGMAHVTGIPLEPQALYRYHYVKRSFIEPSPELRKKLPRLKFNPIPELVKGKRVGLCDDSIVRLNTIPKVVEMLRKAGAKEVHVFVSCPKIVGTCHLGINTPTLEEIAGSSKTKTQIQIESGASSLHFLELDYAVVAVGMPKSSFCHGCMQGGTYAVPKEEGSAKQTKGNDTCFKN